jgi:hypothetical protein
MSARHASLGPLPHFHGQPTLLNLHQVFVSMNSFSVVIQPKIAIFG